MLQTQGEVALSANRGIGLGDSGTTINVASGVLTYNGAAGPAPGASFGSLAKAGSGTLVLGGANIYTGTPPLTRCSECCRFASQHGGQRGRRGQPTAAGNSIIAGSVTVAGGGAIDFSKMACPPASPAY